MQNATVSNPNDFKVVEFHNSTDFDFTPEMGCMFDSRPISGMTGKAGIAAGESITLPYHVGRRLAENLAKQVMVRRAPTVDAAGIPTGVPLWDSVALENLKKSYFKELYSESKPIAQTETDRLMAKVEEYKQMVEKLLDQKPTQQVAAPVQQAQPTVAPTVVTESNPVTVPETGTENNGNVIPDVPNTPSTGNEFQDKQDVIAELEKRGIKHDKRKSKSDLEALLKNQ